ncbi:MAG: hypothetical protein K0V04_38385 [Deltaproteobacteria bacterium]|nr:hypothetical protein [Deltaproteobacteria bacterium]
MPGWYKDAVDGRYCRSYVAGGSIVLGVLILGLQISACRTATPPGPAAAETILAETILAETTPAETTPAETTPAKTTPAAARSTTASSAQPQCDALLAAEVFSTAASGGSPSTSAEISLFAASAGCLVTAKELASNAQRAALAEHPVDVIGLARVGQAFARLGDADAVGRVAQAIENDSRPVAAVAAQLLEARGTRKQEAIWVALDRGDTATARKLLLEIEARALAADPGASRSTVDACRPDCWSSASIPRAWAALGEGDRAVAFAARALEATPHDVGSLDPLAVLEIAEVFARHDDRERTSAALALFETGVVESYAHLALLGRKGGRELLDRGHARVAQLLSDGESVSDVAIGQLAAGYVRLGDAQTALELLSHITAGPELRSQMARLAIRLATDEVVATPTLRRRLSILDEKLAGLAQAAGE